MFFFVVKPVQMMAERGKEPLEEGMPDEERRHQELLAALRAGPMTAGKNLTGH